MAPSIVMLVISFLAFVSIICLLLSLKQNIGTAWLVILLIMIAGLFLLIVSDVVSSLMWHINYNRYVQ